MNVSEKKSVQKIGGHPTFSLFMSRSSTPNFIQGARKVAEFIQGQIKSGSEALSSFFDVQKSKDIASVHDVSADEKYQRHWPPIIQMEKSIKEFNLGGTSNMKGNHLTIVCFDGRDFKVLIKRFFIKL